VSEHLDTVDSTLAQTWGQVLFRAREITLLTTEQTWGQVLFRAREITLLTTE